MAEGVLFNFAGEIVRKLGSLILQELVLLCGIKDELSKLSNSISAIKALLLDAEESHSKSHAVKDWLGKLKDVVYDADDLVDEFSSEALRQQVMAGDNRLKQVCIFFSEFNQLAFGLKMGNKIKRIRENLDSIAMDRQKFPFIEHFKDTNDDQFRVREFSHSYIPEDEVIGRDGDKKAIKNLLMSVDVKKDILLVAIIGMGGIGKTTLAKSLYNDVEVSEHFELKIWICVSDLFDEKIVIAKIIESAIQMKPETDEMDSLQNQLRRAIGGKKYLLVMDDVWNENDNTWFNLKILLMMGAKGSRILITKRDSKLVAEIAAITSQYNLKGLSEGNSWLLFRKMVFNEGEEPKTPNLIKIGKEILQKCNGVPLVIRTIGRLLYFKPSEAEWMFFKDNELSEVTRLGSNIISILKLSYNHLPSNLKQCFAYCSLFPRGFLIRMDELVKLWVAHGFVHSKYMNKSLEEVGDDYFRELLSRSFFQNIGHVSGDIWICQMHDLMHDLALLVAENDCVLGNFDCTTVNEKTRHLSFNCELNSLWNPSASLLKAKKLRTFLLPLHSFSNEAKLNQAVLDKLMLSFTYLRVLDLKSSDIKIIPNSICKLKHLRYLDLSENEHIRFLPNSVSKLQNLQTLNLFKCTTLRKLPRDIGNLINLRHLIIEQCTHLTHMPSGLGKLTCLQTLSSFVLGKKDGSVYRHASELSELNGLNSLRGNLHVKGLELFRYNTSKANAANLKEKQGLQKLVLQWRLNKSHYEAEAANNAERILEGLQPHPNVQILRIEGYGGVRLPNWLPFLVNLVELNLTNCERLQHLPRFDQLVALKFLYLDGLTPLEYITSSSPFSSSTFFPSLQSLSLTNLPNLKGWWKEEFIEKDPVKHCLFPSFPLLTWLNLSNCPKLTSLPLHPPIEHLSMFNVCFKMIELPLTTTLIGNPNMTSSSTSHPLCRLNNLLLGKIQDLEFFTGKFLQDLTSLVYLDISECHNLQMSLSQVVQHLPSIHILHISDCEKLEVSNEDTDDGMQWRVLRNLRYLRFNKISKLMSLPAGLQYVTTLQKLEVSECPNFRALPEWIGNLSSLWQLEIIKCPKLRFLPEGLCQLNSLQELTIASCPILEERCNQETGEDWLKISHVPKFMREQLHTIDMRRQALLKLFQEQSPGVRFGT